MLEMKSKFSAFNILTIFHFWRELISYYDESLLFEY